MQACVLLSLHDPAFVVCCVTVVTVRHEHASAGRNNVKVIKMWALFGNASYDQGSWGFFSPCTVGRAKQPKQPKQPKHP